MEVEQLKQQRCFLGLTVALQPFSYPLGLCQPKEQRKTLDGSGGVDIEERERGQRRAPEPPAKITALMGVGWFFIFLPLTVRKAGTRAF
jgi:hypothetical protein